MARATFVKKAQKDIYTYGKTVQYVSQKGKREGQTLSKKDRTIPQDENDTIFIAKGENYWWWAFQNSPKQYSKEQPKNSQLTQSNYLSQLYSIQEQLDEYCTENAEELSEFSDIIKTDLESLRDECQESYDNIPENLQYASVGELLNDRIQSLDNAISEIEGIDFEIEEKDDDEIKELIAEEKGLDTEEDGWDEDITEEDIENKRQQLETEFVEEKLQELQNIYLE